MDHEKERAKWNMERGNLIGKKNEALKFWSV